MKMRVLIIKKSLFNEVSVLKFAVTRKTINDEKLNNKTSNWCCYYVVKKK